MQRFSVTISQVLLGYANAIRRNFEQFGGQDRICSILMNNIQQLRLNLEQLYELMGGQQKGADAMVVTKPLLDYLDQR